MNRIVLGAIGALLLVGAGIFWWQGRAETERGAAPPALDEVTREQRRFDRLDRNRDGRITRVEMLGPRVAAFRKLDTDHNNLLSFEEWAVKTSDRFRGADRNGDQALTREEFAATKPKPAKHEECRCTPIRRPARASSPSARLPADSGSDEGEPAE